MQVGQSFGNAGVLAELELQVAARRAKRLVDAREHAAQSLRTVGGKQPQPFGVTSRAEAGQCALERLAPDHRAVLVVELAEARVDPHRKRVRSQEARAEAVDRRDPRAVEPPREVVAAARVERRADARAQFAGRLAGVGDDEHRLDVEPLLADGTDEALDQYRRLACARAGRDEDLARRVDGGALLGVQSGTLHAAHRPEVTPGRARATLRVVADVTGPDALRVAASAVARGFDERPELALFEVVVALVAGQVVGSPRHAADRG